MRVFLYNIIFFTVILIFFWQGNRTIRVGLPRPVPYTSYVVFLYKGHHTPGTVICF